MAIYRKILPDSGCTFDLGLYRKYLKEGAGGPAQIYRQQKATKAASSKICSGIKADAFAHSYLTPPFVLDVLFFRPLLVHTAKANLRSLIMENVSYLDVGPREEVEKKFGNSG